MRLLKPAMAALLLAVSLPSGSNAQQANAISASDKAAGTKANPELLQQFGGAYAGPQADYLRRVGQRIAVQSGLSNAQGDFTITLLNSPVNNAFAIPGGYVYVTRQLMALMNNEAELAAVMGHEVGHVAARHASARNRTSTISGIGSLILGVLTGSSAVAQLAGQAAQLYTLRFSRAQEFQADDLGISYLARAGYDPFAESTILTSLAAQSSLDARIAHQAARTLPEWASTHPDPASRVARAAANAERTGIRGGARNADAFLAALDGLMVDDDPSQGTIDGRTFRHRDLRLAFTIPEGFAMSNAADAVTITGARGRAQFKGGPIQANLRRYVADVFHGLDETIAPGPIALSRVDGIETAAATARTNTGSGPVDVTVFAYGFAPGTAYHFATIVPAGEGSGAFAPMFASFRRLAPTEAQAIRARRISVITVRPGDTIATLSARMAYGDLRIERFLTLNALSPNASLRPGQKLKIVVYG